MYIGGDLGQTMGPMLGGMVTQYTEYGTMYLWSIAPLLVAWIYFFLREKVKTK